MYEGPILVYQLVAVIGVLTKGVVQGADGAWRQAARIDYQEIYVLILDVVLLGGPNLLVVIGLDILVSSF